MGDGTGSAPPGPDRTVTPALPPGGGHLLYGHRGQCVASLCGAAGASRLSPAETAPASPSRHSSSRTAPGLDSGSLPFPHLGDWMHDGAPGRALAARDGLGRGRCSHSLGRAEAALGEAGAAVVPVVDEDRQPAGSRVEVGRDPADIPAVAGRDQRQQPDRGMLGGVRRAGQVHARGRPARLAGGPRSSTTRPWCAACAAAGRAVPRRSAGRSPVAAGRTRPPGA